MTSANRRSPHPRERIHLVDPRMLVKARKIAAEFWASEGGGHPPGSHEWNVQKIRMFVKIKKSFPLLPMGFNTIEKILPAEEEWPHWRATPKKMRPIRGRSVSSGEKAEEEIEPESDNSQETRKGRSQVQSPGHFKNCAFGLR